MVSPLEVMATMATMATVGLFGILAAHKGNYPDVAIVAVLPYLLRVVSTCLGHDHRRSWTRHDVYPMEEGEPMSVRPTPKGHCLMHRPWPHSQGRWWPDLQGPPRLLRRSPTGLWGWHQEAPARRPGASHAALGPHQTTVLPVPRRGRNEAKIRMLVDLWCTRNA